MSLAFIPRHSNSKSQRHGVAAENGEKAKNKNYERTGSHYIYAVDIETNGVFGSNAMTFIGRIDEKMFQITNDKLTKVFREDTHQNYWEPFFSINRNLCDTVPLHPDQLSP